MVRLNFVINIMFNQIQTSKKATFAISQFRSIIFLCLYFISVSRNGENPAYSSFADNFFRRFLRIKNLHYSFLSKFSLFEKKKKILFFLNHINIQ